MAPLRFRVWRPGTRQMIGMDDIKSLTLKAVSNELDGVYCWVEGQLYCGLPDEIVIMQSTGLFDSRGVEIFEGDIVKFQTSKRVGTKRSRNGRRYDSFAAYKDVVICGVVRNGPTKASALLGPVYGWFIETEQSATWPSYFYGSGKASDKPVNHTENWGCILSEKILPILEIIGNVHENGELLEANHD